MVANTLHECEHPFCLTYPVADEKTDGLRGGGAIRTLDTSKEVTESNRRHPWLTSENKEMKSLKEYEPYKRIPLIEMPSGRKAIGMRFVKKFKINKTLKSKLVVHVFNQPCGFNFGNKRVALAVSTSMGDPLNR